MSKDKRYKEEKGEHMKKFSRKIDKERKRLKKIKK